MNTVRVHSGVCLHSDDCVIALHIWPLLPSHTTLLHPTFLLSPPPTHTHIHTPFIANDASKGGSSSTAAASSRAELWRQAKRQRAAEWAAFNAARPDDTYDAPEDVAALQHAADTIGDFKLKSDPGFMLPEVRGGGRGGEGEGGERGRGGGQRKEEGGGDA